MRTRDYGEARAIFLLAGEGHGDALTPLLADANWGRLARIAEREGAHPVIWRALGANPSVTIPSSAGEQLHRRSMVAEFNLQRMERALLSALSDLETAGIQPVLLKGAAMVAATYDSFRQRPMGDIDLLLEDNDIHGAHDVLIRRGWWSDGKASLDAFYRGHQHLPVLFNDAGIGISIELHRDWLHLGHPFRFGAADIRRDSVEVQLAGRRVRIPTAAHLMLHACVHFAWCHMGRLGAWKTFRDLHALTNTGLIDWGALGALAKRARAESAVYWTLHLAGQLSRLRPPSATLDSLRPTLPRGVLGLLNRHFILNLLSASDPCPSRWFSRTMWSAAMQPGRSGHGDERPWSRDHFWTGQPPTKSIADNGSTRFSVRAWRGYLRGLTVQA